MENNKTRVSVFVAGQRFNILTDKSEKYVLDIASEIDARINSLVVSQDMNRERAAVLTALDYADDIELDKENIAAVKEQIKDYVKEIERLNESNAKVISDYNLLKAEYERLIAEKRSAEDAQKALEESQAQVKALNDELSLTKEKLSSAEAARSALEQSEAKMKELEDEAARLRLELESVKLQPNDDSEEAVPLPEEPPVEKEKPITAEDDLFFDEPEEAPVKPQKDKKKRHDHNHVNPYQQKAKQKEEKGYTQQRQYSLFDIDE